MKAVITVIGTDQVGIVHRVSELCVKHQLNIEDISQTLMDSYFTMITLVNISQMTGTFSEIVEDFDRLSDELGLTIRVQHEDLFNQMHNV
ncbi:ACT domain-containing protein [Dolosicoccus paucivorans]